MTATTTTPAPDDMAALYRDGAIDAWAVSRATRLSGDQVYNLLSAGRLPYAHVGNQWLVPRRSVAEASTFYHPPPTVSAHESLSLDEATREYGVTATTLRPLIANGRLARPNGLTSRFVSRRSLVALLARATIRRQYHPWCQYCLYRHQFTTWECGHRPAGEGDYLLAEIRQNPKERTLAHAYLDWAEDHDEHTRGQIARVLDIVPGLTPDGLDCPPGGFSRPDAAFEARRDGLRCQVRAFAAITAWFAARGPHHCPRPLALASVCAGIVGREFGLDVSTGIVIAAVHHVGFRYRPLRGTCDACLGVAGKMR